MSALPEKPMDGGSVVNSAVLDHMRRQAEAELADKVRTITVAMLSGTMASFAGAPPAMVLKMIAGAMGSLMVGAVRGDLPALLALRRDLKNAFADGVQSVDIGKQQNIHGKD